MKKLLVVLGLAFCALASAQVPPAVTIKWQPVLAMDDNTPILFPTAVTYDIYGGHTATGPWTPAATNIVGNSTVRSGVALGVDCYYVVAKVNGVVSLPSDSICLTVVAKPQTSTVPAKPSGLTVEQTQ